jgi:DNA repair exonuclease SbcCD nuclease subunit
MKAAITADLQFGPQAKLSYETDRGISSRLADQVRCFRWIVDTAVERGCETLLSLGDIFDARNAIPVPVNDQVGRCYAYAAEKMENHILVGNHDCLLRSPTVNSLQPLRGLATVWESAGTYGPLAFVPWIEDPDDYRAAIGRVARDKEARYLFSHVLIEGAVPDAIGRAKRDLRPQRWDLIFLGDVHSPLEFPPNFQYAGAPMQHHFGDVGGERGFWILDTDGGEYEYIENERSPCFHVVTGADDLHGIREGDFVRVRTDDPELAESFATAAGKVTAWVENETVRLTDEAQPRLDVSGEASYEGILRRYVEHCDFDGVPGLVETGLELIQAVE